MEKRVSRRRNGSVLFWSVVLIPVLLMVGLVSVDAGAIYTTRSKLQGATDSAARYAAMALREGNVSEARKHAKDAMRDDTIGGAKVKLENSDIEFGLWDPKHATFTVVPVGEEAGATAVRVTARMRKDEGTGAQSYFGTIFGYNSYSLTTQATAAIGEPVSVEIKATSSPYLAGVGPGGEIPFTGYSELDWAPSASTWEACGPAEVEVALSPGERLWFRDVEGSTGDYNSGLTYGLEGNLSRPRMAQTPVNGFDTTYAPLNSLMGVFLTDDAPQSTGYVPGLDYSDETLREQLVHDPLNKQIFFIGDGVRNKDSRLQEFIVPDGATRLFLGLSDENGFWWDNFGNYRTTLFKGDIQLVD